MHIIASLKPDYEPINPLQMAIGLNNIELNGTPIEKIITEHQEVLSSIKEDLAAIVYGITGTSGSYLSAEVLANDLRMIFRNHIAKPSNEYKILNSIKPIYTAGIFAEADEQANNRARIQANRLAIEIIKSDNRSDAISKIIDKGNLDIRVIDILIEVLQQRGVDAGELIHIRHQIEFGEAVI